MKRVKFGGGISYLAPSVERLRVSAEKGFAASLEDEDYGTSGDFDFKWDDEDEDTYA